MCKLNKINSVLCGTTLVDIRGGRVVARLEISHGVNINIQSVGLDGVFNEGTCIIFLIESTKTRTKQLAAATEKTSWPVT